MVEKNNQTITFNILYIKEKEICLVYISKINSNFEKQIILLMIPSEEKEGWHYLAVKELSALLRGITSKHDGNSYCLNVFILLEQKINLNLKKKYVENRFLLNCNAIRKG